MSEKTIRILIYNPGAVRRSVPPAVHLPGLTLPVAVDEVNSLDALRDLLHGRLQQPAYDLVVTELASDPPLGLDDVSVLRGELPDVPIVVRGADGTGRAASVALRAGADIYVGDDPDEAAQLERAITGALEQHQLVRELLERTACAEASRHCIDAMIAASADGMVVIGDGGCICFANPAAGEMFGRSPNELLGQPYGFPLLNGAAAEIELDRPDGSRTVAEVRMAAIDWEGQAAHVATLRDVGQRKHAEAEQRRMEQRLQQSQKRESLALLADGVARDLNSILATVLGNVDLAQMRLPAKSAVHDALEEIARAALRAGGLTEQLLAYSGEGTFEVEPVNLSDFVAEVSRRVESSVASDTRFQYELADHLPPVDADPAQLRQLVMHLVLNAAEAVEDTGGAVTVSTGLAEYDAEAMASAVIDPKLAPGDRVFLRVGDEGVGMDAETLDRMFDPFFTTKFPGRGLGLAAVMGIVRGHQAALHVDSEPGHGTQVTVFFPYSQRAERILYAVPDTMATSTDLGLVDVPVATHTVLLIDAEEHLRRLLGRALERVGVTSINADNVEEALRRLRLSGRPLDLAIVEVDPHRQEAGRLLKLLREVEPDLPLIVTSTTSLDHLSGLLQGEVLAYIQKPYHIADVVDQVREALDV